MKTEIEELIEARDMLQNKVKELNETIDKLNETIKKINIFIGKQRGIKQRLNSFKINNLFKAAYIFKLRLYKYFLKVLINYAKAQLVK